MVYGSQISGERGAGGKISLVSYAKQIRELNKFNSINSMGKLHVIYRVDQWGMRVGKEQ